MTKTVITLGILGLVDIQTDPVVQTLLTQDRFHLTAAYSPVYHFLERQSRKIGIVPYGSLCNLLRSQAVAGLIWNSETAPFTLESLGLGLGARHILARMETLQQLSLERLSRLHQFAEREHLEIFPELPLRWTPSTLRLRELVATQLGPIREIQLSAQSSQAETSRLLQQLDWVRMLLATTDLTVSSSKQGEIEVNFARPGGQTARCLLSRNNETSSATPEDSTCQAKVSCEAGQLEIISDVQIRWKSTAEWIDESHLGERSTTAVMLDLFGRRIAGGIVPVPDLVEVLKSQRLLQTVHQVEESGETISIDERSLSIHN